MARTFKKSLCKKCGQEFLNSNIPLHEKRCDGSGKLPPFVNKGIGVGHPKGKPAWNKGLTKETDNRVKKNAEGVSATLKKQYAEGRRPSIMGDEGRFNAS